MKSYYQELKPFITSITPALVERGKIKIGKKGRFMKSRSGKEFQPPTKLDHFIITNLNRDNTGNFEKDIEIHKAIGSDSPKEIPIRLIYDDIFLNFRTRFACFKGKTLACTGDGEKAFRLIKAESSEREQVSCPCERVEKEFQETAGNSAVCKPNGVLSVMIDGIPVVGGVWKFRTTSWNSVQGIISSLSLIKRLSGGILAGIPLKLRINPKSAVLPNNKMQTNYIVSIEYPGSIPELKQSGYNIALENKTHEIKIENIENEAKKLLAGPIEDLGEDTEDIVSEYYPEQAENKSDLKAAEAVRDETTHNDKPDEEKTAEEAKTKEKEIVKTESEMPKIPEPEKEPETVNNNKNEEPAPETFPTKNNDDDDDGDFKVF